MSWLIGIGVTIVAIIALFFVLVAVSSARARKNAREQQAALGRELGTWTVYYDVEGRRIGLQASFGEPELLRYLLFRAHDLFDYYQGLEADRRQLGEALRAAGRGAGETWQLAFPPGPGECYHAYDSPKGKLFKFFEGSLYEHGVSQPRFLGGDLMAKQRGLVGECLALAAHLRADPARAVQVTRATELLVERELAQPRAPSGAKFWSAPNDALAAVG